MIPLTADEAGAALGLPPLAQPVCGVGIDSRATRPGDLFIALHGERFDGHDFVGAALAAGACAAVVRADEVSRLAASLPTVAVAGTSPGTARGPFLYAVPDTLAALWALARAVRRKSGAQVFAVTGSVGKTTTKEILGAMVKRVRRVVTTASNQNNEIGVPLTLLALDPLTEAAVVEMGMRGKGQISLLAQVAEPDVGVITNIHPVHLELLGSLDNIAQAKAELLCGLAEGGVGVVPADCTVLAAPAAQAGCRLVRFSVGEECDPGEVEVRVAWRRRVSSLDGELAVFWPEGEAEVEVSGMPAYLAENIAAAIAACYAGGLPIERCLEGIQEIRPLKGRGEVLRLPGLTVIDDSYNANPAAVKRALEHLMEVVAGGGRPVAVLGDMLELGPEEMGLHEEVGWHAARLGVAQVWGVGERSQATVRGFLKGNAGGEAGHIPSVLEISAVMQTLRRGDVVLVKASRSIGLEKLVTALVEQAQAGRWEEPGIGGTAK